MSLGDVEDVDPAFDGQLKDRLRLFLGNTGREHRPGAQTHIRYSKATFAEILVAQSGRWRRSIAQWNARIWSEAYWSPCCWIDPLNVEYSN